MAVGAGRASPVTVVRQATLSPERCTARTARTKKRSTVRSGVHGPTVRRVAADWAASGFRPVIPSSLMATGAGNCPFGSNDADVSVQSTSSAVELPEDLIDLSSETILDSISDAAPSPGVRFFTLYRDVRAPEPASSTVRGSLPTRANQFCVPILEASRLGWYLYPPIDFALRWDGTTSEWSPLVDNEPVAWKSLAGNVDVGLPEKVEQLRSTVTDRLETLDDLLQEGGGHYPMLNADPRALHLIEFSFGIITKTNPGWSLLTRGVPNWPTPRPVDVLEGVTDFDWNCGDLTIILRMRTPNEVARFYRSEPIAVAQPVFRSHMAREIFSEFETTTGLENWSDEVFDQWVASRRRRREGIGSYRNHRRRALTGGRAEPTE